MVGIAVGSIVLTAVLALSLYSGRSFASLANYADLNADSMYAIDRMTTDVRQAISVSSFSSNQIVLNYGTNQPSLSFTYDAPSRQLVRTFGTDKSVLLAECDYFHFNVYQRSPKAGTYDQFLAASTATAKVIEVNWVCSRKIFGARVNTENAQTAKIVIRKH